MIRHTKLNFELLIVNSLSKYISVDVEQLYGLINLAGIPG